MTKRRPVENWLTTRYPGLYRLDGYDDRWRYRKHDPRTGKPIQGRMRGVGIREAKAAMDKAVAEAQRFSRRRRGRPPTVREFGETWRAEIAHAPGSAAALEKDLRLHVYPAKMGRTLELGDMSIDEVGYLHAVRFVNLLTSSDLAITTQGNIDTHARQLFNAAVADEWLTVSPFARVPHILKGNAAAQLRQGEYVPTVAEALRMADLAWQRGQVDAWAFILWTIGTGMRSGEIRGASAEQIDYPQPTRIVVDQQVQHDKVDGLGDGKAVHYFTTPKSEAGKRVVPLALFVVETVTTLTAWRAPREMTLPWVERGFVRDQERTRLVLMPAMFGGAMLKSTIGRLVSKLARDAGVVPLGSDERPLPLRVTPNSLRKTFNRVLDKAGVPLKVRDEVTGHASEGITLQVYTPTDDEGLAMVRDAVQAAYLAARAEADEAAKTDEKTGSE